MCVFFFKSHKYKYTSFSQIIRGKFFLKINFKSEVQITILYLITFKIFNKLTLKAILQETNYKMFLKFLFFNIRTKNMFERKRFLHLSRIKICLK